MKDGAREGQTRIQIAQVTKLPIWGIRADHIFLSCSAHFLVFSGVESFLLIPCILSVVLTILIRRTREVES